ncbi:unnamed protein product [Didymodactylos carnosus]|uniref:Uncharacterized protein n=1 Tax=Didymodactylos carnosus TaxID=1234261 RepID=A0A815XJX8_9BILA|nr:unnamed protein product [Didymodactylos carnosus]CAF4419694.1 unnamed protein product [Didymodactylos carnosus]
MSMLVATVGANQKKKKNKQNVPSFAHVALILHLFGDVHYIWRKSAKDDEDPEEDTWSQNLQLASGSQTQSAECSAYNYTYNKIIDYTSKKTINDQPDEKELQDQILDIHTKAVIIIPRLCILFQIFNYAMDVLKECEDHVVFDEGYLVSRKINQLMVRKATEIVNQILASAPRSQYYPQMPMLFVEKPACIAACDYYDYLNNMAVILFTLQESPTEQYVSKKSLSMSRLTTLISSSNVLSTSESTICLFPFNFFMFGALASRMPEPLETKNSPFHNCSHLVEPALTNLMTDGILISGDFLVDSKNRRHKSIMKVPVPHDQQKRDLFEAKLKKYNVKLSDYEALYKTSAKPTKCGLSRETIYFYSQIADFVPEYSKYKTDMKETIEYLMKDGHITEVIVNNDIQYAISSTSTHFRPLPIDKATYEQLRKELPLSLKQKRTGKINSVSTPQQPLIPNLQLLHRFASDLSTIDINALFEMLIQTNLSMLKPLVNSSTNNFFSGVTL